jgi:hypothetical protein
MSHARTSSHTLRYGSDGCVELLQNARTVWASDADPAFAEEFGDDPLGELLAAGGDNEDEDELTDDILDYLIAAGLMSENDAQGCWQEFPSEDDPADEREDPDPDDDGDT